MSGRKRVDGNHGMSQSKEYYTWCHMLERCRQPSCKDYPRYGGRGISVCDEWLSFMRFYSDMGPRPEGTSLDRLDTNGDYCKSNCRWASKLEQANNTRTNKYLSIGGITKSMADWARESGVSYYTLKDRVRKSYPEELLLTKVDLRSGKICRFTLKGNKC